MIDQGRVVLSIWSIDRHHRLDVVERADGQFDLVGVCRLSLRNGQSYWDEGEHAGPYESVEEAKREALAGIPWMKGPVQH
jgi:hypothetical protein